MPPRQPIPARNVESYVNFLIGNMTNDSYLTENYPHISYFIHQNSPCNLQLWMQVRGLHLSQMSHLQMLLNLMQGLNLPNPLALHMFMPFHLLNRLMLQPQSQSVGNVTSVTP